MVSVRALISNPFKPRTKPLEIVPSAPITIDITVTFIFHIFFSSLSKYLSLFSFSLIFSLLSNGTANPLSSRFTFFLLTINKPCHLAKIKWSASISKFQSILRVSSFRRNSRLCRYHLFVWSNFSFVYNSKWITLSCLVFYSFITYVVINRFISICCVAVEG